MKLSDVKEANLVEIVKLYEQHCGFGREFREAMFHNTPSYILEQIKSGKLDEYRIGSRWDGHSKIYFSKDIQGNFIVRFYSNFAPEDRETPDWREAEKAGEEFTKAAMAYLNK